MGRRVTKRCRAAGVIPLAEWLAGFLVLACSTWVAACSDPPPASGPHPSSTTRAQPEAVTAPEEPPSASTAVGAEPVAAAAPSSQVVAEGAPMAVPAPAPVPVGALAEAAAAPSADPSPTQRASLSPDPDRGMELPAPAGSATATASREAASFLTRLSQDCAVTLNRVSLARGVDRPQREPFGVSRHFVADGSPVYVFMDVHNPSGPEQEMTVRWEHLGSDHTFTQTIPAGASPRWRTWVYHRIWPGQLGDWRVQILTPSACQVAELTFETST